MRPPRRLGLIVAVLTVVVASGCTVPERSTGQTGTTVATIGSAEPPDAPEPSTAVHVTVPGLGGASSAPVASVVAGPSAEGGSSGSSAPGDTSSSPAGSVTAGGTPAPTTARTVTVDTARCGGCTVLATRKGVLDNLSAAFVGANGNRAALMSLGADGAVKKVVSVPYGSSFAPPSDGLLTCDSAGRCIVFGKNANGKAIGSAFALQPDGNWTDVSMPGGFASATAKGQTVDVDGEPGIAIQAAGAGKVVWTVYAWSGPDDGYFPVGCEPDGPLDVNSLSPEACLS